MTLTAGSYSLLLGCSVFVLKITMHLMRIIPVGLPTVPSFPHPLPPCPIPSPRCPCMLRNSTPFSHLLLPRPHNFTSRSIKRTSFHSGRKRNSNHHHHSRNSRLKLSNLRRVWFVKVVKRLVIRRSLPRPIPPPYLIRRVGLSVPSTILRTIVQQNQRNHQ